MRRNRGLLQKQLAVILGHRSHRCISHYESGTALPTLETALLLEIALGVKLAELYPDLYRRLQDVALKRAKHLPDVIRRSLISRLLHQDLPYDHTRTH
ncbi:MAG: helix-turn-helix domain-containing protein [Bryobacteraceae bacterium]